MSKLEDLINKLCPEGVEYKTLNEVTKWDKRFNNINNNFYKSFNHVSAAKLKDLKNDKGTVKLLSTGNFDGVALKEDAMEYLNNDEIFTIPSGGAANIKYFKGEFVDSGNIIGTSLNSDLYNTKYIYYFLENNNEIIQSFFRGSGVKHPDMSAILNIKIAVPPLEVQCEIVHILDDFTLLSAELSAELNARKKQYDYYKDELLVFDRNDTKISWISLGECCKRLKGTAITAGQMKKIACEGGEVRIFAGGKTVVDTTPENINQGDIITVPNIIVQSRGIIDFIYYEKPCSFKREMWSYTNDNKVTLKYIYYYLKKNVEFFRKRGSQMGSMPQISLDVTEKYMIPIPSIAEQERVVNILEKFDELCNNISYGLPAEIEKRQKQYEYYRDKLLSFKEVEVNE